MQWAGVWVCNLVGWPLLAFSCCSVSIDPLAIHAGTLDQTMTIHLLGIACKNVELPGNPWRDSILEAPSVKHNCKSNKKLWKGVEGSWRELKGVEANYRHPKTLRESAIPHICLNEVKYPAFASGNSCWISGPSHSHPAAGHCFQKC